MGSNKIIVKKTGNKLFSMYRFITLFCIGIVLMYPIMNIFTIAFRPIAQMADPNVIWIPKSVTLDNFKYAWDAMDFDKAALYSLIITVGSTFLQVAACAMAGYGFARYKFKARNILFGMVLFTILIPPETIIIPKYLQYWRFDFFGLSSLVELLSGKTASTNILGTVWTMFVPAALGNGIRSGLFIYIFRQFFCGLPKEIEEAAYIDGCGPFRTFVKVMIPSAGVAFVTVIIFSVVWYWNDYLNASMYLGNIPTVSPKLATLKSSLSNLFGLAGNVKFGNPETNPYRMSAAIQAGCLLALLPLLIMYSFLQKYFIESIERTGIVG